MSRSSLARALALATVAWGIAFYALGAAAKPGYSSVAQYISELNATGTAHAWALGLFGFVPMGLLFAAFLVLVTPLARATGASRIGLALMWSQPIAFLGVALAPCDAGCPIGGTPTQQLHDLLGVSTYAAGALGLFLLSFHPALAGRGRGFFRAAAIAWIVLFVAMLQPELAAWRGLLQRVADLLLGIAVLVMAWAFGGAANRTSR